MSHIMNCALPIMLLSVKYTVHNQSNTQSIISPTHSPQPTWFKQY